MRRAPAQSGPLGRRCTAYVATTLAALIAALVLALAPGPARAQAGTAAVTPQPLAAEALRRVSLQSTDAGGLLAALRFLRHAPGQEVLGIAYAAAYLRAAEASRIDAEPFDALGTMAERLAQRASDGRGGEAAAAQLEAVGAHGVRFVTIEREGRLRQCYDGAAFRRVLALAPSPEAQARAMLALTRHDCVDPALAAQARVALDAWRADLLDLPWPRGYDTLPALTQNRLHMRRAGLWAARAHQFSRLNRPVQPAAERALAELATVNRSDFTDEDHAEYAEAAIRVGAVRAAALPQATASGLAEASAHGLRLVVRAGAEAGQTCVLLLAAEGHGGASAGVAGSARPVGTVGTVGTAGTASTADSAGSAAASARAAETRGPHRLAERCTFGTVWARSLAVRPAGDALVLAVQPLEGWTELWVFRAEPQARAGAHGGARAWRVDVLPPAPAHAGLGYIEFAGWVPGAQPQLLVAREARTEGRFHRRFEVLSLDSLDAVKQASVPSQLVAFGQWSDAQWRQHTVALR